MLPQLIRRPVLVAQILVRRRVVGEPLGLCIPLQIRLRLQRNVRDQRCRRGLMAGQHVAIALGAALHAVQEVPRMESGVVAALSRSGRDDGLFDGL